MWLEAFRWLALASIVESSALTLLKIGGLKQIIGASLIFGLGVVPLLSMSLKYEGIGIVNFVWNVLSTISMFVIGIYFFNEKVENLQLIGIIITLIGLALVLISSD